MSTETPKYAPKREDGLSAYVRIRNSWGKSTETVVWATNLAEAKKAFGWTRENFTSIHLRRATPAEASSLREYQR